MNLLRLFKDSQAAPPAPKDYSVELPDPYTPPACDTRIRVLRACRGSSDGIKVTEFAAGQVVEVSAALATTLCDLGVAEIV